MYPLFRLIRQVWEHRAAPPLPLTGTHVSHHLCLPWDIDPWAELNNGRVLTLYDLGRIVLFRRVGAVAAMRRRGWVGAVAGLSIRYRRRVRIWDRYSLHSRFIGHDARFFYCEQAMWRQGECTSHAVLRLAITSGARGIVPTSEVIAEIGSPAPTDPLPDWVQAWIASEQGRPWPPVLGSGGPDR